MIISITQHGVILAASQIVTVLVAKLVILPLSIVKTTAQMAEMAAASDDEKLATMLSRSQTSIVSMNAKNPILQTLASIPVPANIPAHSIITVEGDGPIEKGDDGVVTYKSPHIDEAVSELEVRLRHSCQDQSETIEEIRRILLEHYASVK